MSDGILASERDVTTASSSMIGYERGCRISCVHDVRKTKQALIFAQAELDIESEVLII